MKTVYYCGGNSMLFAARFFEPEPAIKHMDTDAIKSISINKCPAFTDYFKNTYALTWCFDYELQINPDGSLRSDMYDQRFFDNTVLIRDGKYRSYTLQHFYLMTCEEPLEMEVVPVTGTHNGFIDNISLYSGMFDIGRWFRPVECTFTANPDADKLTIKTGEPYSFIKFQTDEPIKFQRFHPTDEIREIEYVLNGMRFFNGNKRYSLNDFYNRLKVSGYKRRLMKLIKENLV